MTRPALPNGGAGGSERGNTIRNTRTVHVDDAVKITSIEVTGIDEQPTMEIEVYLYDDTTNELLGCAGSANGLLAVDHPDVHYAVDARLIDASGNPLHGSDIASRMLRFEVWEDDDGPVCPTPISPTGNNLVAKSAGASYEAWKGRSTPAAFGTVARHAVRSFARAVTARSCMTARSCRDSALVP